MTPTYPINGVIADGSEPNFKLPPQYLSIVRATTAIVRLRVCTQQGAPVPLAGATGYFTMRITANDQLPLVSRQVAGGSTNLVDFLLSAVDTDQAFSQLVWNALIVFGDGTRADSTWAGVYYPLPPVAHIGDVST